MICSDQNKPKCSIRNRILLSMRRPAAVLLCLCAVFSLASCGDEAKDKKIADGETKDIAVRDIVTSCIELYDPESDVPPTMHYYNSGAGEDDEDYLDPGYAGVLFYDEYGTDMSVLNNLDSYCMAVPEGKRIFEIDVMKTKSPDDVEAVKKLLQERFNRKNNGDILTYTPEEDPYLQQTQIFDIGNYVFLISTTDNQKAIDAVNGMLR